MSAPTTNIISRLSPVKFASEQGTGNEKQSQKESTDEVNSTDSVDGETDSKVQVQVTCVPFVLEFRRLLQNPKFMTVDVIPGVSKTLSRGGGGGGQLSLKYVVHAYMHDMCTYY